MAAIDDYKYPQPTAEQIAAWVRLQEMAKRGREREAKMAKREQEMAKREQEMAKREREANAQVRGKKMTTIATYKTSGERFAYCQENVLKTAFAGFIKKGFHPVMGSMGFTSDSHEAVDGVWWEYGGPDWTTVAQFIQSKGMKHDYHCWFEDSDGNIADVDWREYMMFMGYSRSHVSFVGKRGHWKVRTAADWKSVGFHHKAAPEMVQKLVMQYWERQ